MSGGYFLLNVQCYDQGGEFLVSIKEKNVS